jgi:hypothetical protein
LGYVEVGLAVPERVIAVETHHPDRHRTSDSTFANTGCPQRYSVQSPVDSYALDTGPCHFADDRRRDALHATT